MIGSRNRDLRHAHRHSHSAVQLPRNFRVEFGACYAYSPHGSNKFSEKSRLLCARLKSTNVRWLQCYALRVREEFHERGQFSDIFGPGAVLIPVPGSTPSHLASHWVARQLAIALQTVGLADRVWLGLARITAVPRSSTSWLWQRPSVTDHYLSLCVMSAFHRPAQFVLIDDVVTKGRTLVAAALRLHQAIPRAQIRAFALMRTMSWVEDVPRLIEPCHGEIYWNGRDAFRHP